MITKSIRLLILWAIGLPVCLIYCLCVALYEWVKEARWFWYEARMAWRCTYHAHREILNPGCHQREAIERMMPKRDMP